VAVNIARSDNASPLIVIDSKATLKEN